MIWLLQDDPLFPKHDLDAEHCTTQCIVYYVSYFFFFFFFLGGGGQTNIANIDSYQTKPKYDKAQIVCLLFWMWCAWLEFFTRDDSFYGAGYCEFHNIKIVIIPNLSALGMSVYIFNLSLRGCGLDIECVIYKCLVVITSIHISSAITFKWTVQNLSRDKSALLLVMTWCRQATKHYLRKCYARSLTPFGRNKFI